MKLRRERFERRNGSGKNSHSSSNWMVTFSDLITLILVFFILLFSMSQIDLQKFKAAVDSIQKEGGGLQPGQTSIEKKGTSPADAKKQEDQQDQLLKKVNTYIKDNHLKTQMTAKRDERGVVLVLQEAVLFDSGEAKVLKNAETLLHQIAVLLQTIPNDIQVEGHTDSRNISTYRYPSNWELSAARASGVIQYFTSKEKLPSKRFIAVGYADTKPVKDNKTNEHMKENRRVEIVIKK
ncbi:flagellar motor protein MotS [Bacillus spizizenii]|uniref:Flagellar motor protein n=1 Tax=Bacillus spizizenii (strain DSM 15029 / JCM 12233 / NBRC 101239 / NRRL B-23049 / TU-B-10) TaxID=1052585 RepID=G4NZJ3_BACS4|nr:flagellar motor protein MotS [Bacillus spizizenii]SCV43277.1 Flagellar motor rotation protein MotB [Bacillus subtilis]AEP87822.1 flagellar motor protein [Bacillus spizizenii TU-B-10]KXJ38274.1 flagellar motor protein MotS [Bacillus spizizenii]MCI4169871.1 flagellar motor protein MotB [Bacillus spizizenii]MEC1433725.1 flagellar motor protein MotS [Bacillus spizizenii]